MKWLEQLASSLQMVGRVQMVGAGEYLLAVLAPPPAFPPATATLILTTQHLPQAVGLRQWVRDSSSSNYLGYLGILPRVPGTPT